MVAQLGRALFPKSFYTDMSHVKKGLYMGFTVEDYLVRGDLFRDTNKWYTSVVINMSKVYERSFRTALILAIRDSLPKDSYRGMTIVILEPYHKYAHPAMLSMDEVWDRDLSEEM